MVLLARHEESIKARLCFAFSYQSIHLSFPIHSLHKQFFHIDFWVSLNFFFFFLSKAFLSFLVFQTLKTKLVLFIFSFPSPFAKNNSPRTNCLNSFCVSLLPFPKEQRTNRLNSFVSPFSLVKAFKMTQSENSFDSSLSHIQKISKD